VLAVGLLLCGAPAFGGEQGNNQVVERAEQLRNVHDFPAAVQLLEPYVASHPEDAHAARLLAQTWYWLGNVAAAERAYEQALSLHPNDVRTRLDFARLLVETTQVQRARAQLMPLASARPVIAEVSTLLGTIAYWAGDLTTAAARFREALAVDPAHAEARRQLDEIASITRSWVAVLSSLWHDDQPLDRIGVGFEAGWYLTPLAPLHIRVEPLHYALLGSTTSVWTAVANLSHFEPHGRLETEIAGGILRRSAGESATSWIGRAAVAVRLPRRVRIGGRLERSPYLHTLASLETAVMITTAAAQLRLDDSAGWLGEAEFRGDHYADNNATRSAYAWLLAPIVRRQRWVVQAGYAAAVSDSDELRFVLADRMQPYPPGDPRFDTTGVYDPYYTPRNQLSHSVITAVRLSRSGGATLHAGGSYAFHATEDAPSFFVSPDGMVQRSEAERELTPWRGRLDLAVPISSRATLSLSGEVGRTSFYRWTTAVLRIVYRFNHRSPSVSPVPQ
jgi:tetratricopeptide (TPR) repeat protein